MKLSVAICTHRRLSFDELKRDIKSLLLFKKSSKINRNTKKQSRMLQDELFDSSDDDDDIICYRCGRPGHKSNECYAQKHKKGYWLD